MEQCFELLRTQLRTGKNVARGTTNIHGFSGGEVRLNETKKVIGHRVHTARNCGEGIETVLNRERGPHPRVDESLLKRRIVGLGCGNSLGGGYGFGGEECIGSLNDVAEGSIPARRDLFE